jgi:squalene-hopene/tetraprenyl-beta-curcumene cyclase
MCTLQVALLGTLFAAAPEGPPPEAPAPEAPAPSVEQVRQAVQRSIPFIQDKGQWWIEKKKCVSCHRVGNMVWSLRAARDRGFKVSRRLDEWSEWGIKSSLSPNGQGKVTGRGNKEGVAQLLFARREDRDNTDDDSAKLLGILAEDLQADGSWKPGGQLPSQKRDLQETTDVTTMWLALALADAAAGSHSALVDQAVQHIRSSPPGKSTEWFVVRLLLASRLGEETTKAELIQRLKQQQRPDGGWGWLVGDASDALGTGMSVYALLQTGLEPEDAVIRRAQQFLIDSQRDDGSWPVHGTKAKKKHRVEETAVYWGATWAVLGLVESLPQPAASPE